MTELLTAAQMRSLEQAAIASGEVTGLELMERAGRGVVEAIFEEWPELKATSHRAVILCGPGNNGGDGFVVARLLKEWGWEVEVFLYGDPEKLPPDARVNYERWTEIGQVQPFDDDAYEEDPHNAPTLDLLVDALFGTGLTRPVDGCATLMHYIEDVVEYRDAETKVVSVDIPTGLDTDSGEPYPIEGSAPPHIILPHLTVTFHKPKVGHYIGWGPSICQKLRVTEIGLKESVKDLVFLAESVRGDMQHADRDLTAYLETQDGLFPVLKAPRTHKYSYGHALVLSGGAGKGGAARLAARGALRIGAGLVTLGGPATVQYEHCSQTTAIMWRQIGGAAALDEALEDARINALCLGPGLGQGTGHLVLAALKGKRATVLDADALTQFQRNPEVLFDALHENVVLTPHAGEFARLFPDIAGKLNAPAKKGPAYSKVDATREAAQRAGCTVLFKGPDTVIANETGAARINSAHYDRAAPWLATAGAGDVLAGFITGLLARGFAPLEAASTAAWLHVECALSFGPGLIAEDIPEELPKVFRALGL